MSFWPNPSVARAANGGECWRDPSRLSAGTATTAATRAVIPVVAFLCLLGGSCGQKALAKDEAERIVRAEVSDKDFAINVSGISQDPSKPTEAVVLALADTTSMKLNFRRYDSGWKWESAEIGGTVVSSVAATMALRNRMRLRRAYAWAQPHLEEYRQTADTISWLRGHLNRLPTEELDQHSWDIRHESMLKAFSLSSRTPDEKEALLARLRIPMDAWQHRIVWVLNPAERGAHVASPGPDGIAGTSDDLVCQLTGSKHWDSFYEKELWDYGFQWTLPEGLESAVSEFVEPKDRGSATFVAIVK